MKTLHLSTEWSFRGGEQQVLLLVRGLQKEGYQADLLCQPDSELYVRALDEQLAPQPLRMRGEVDLIAAWKIARIISRERYNIVHSHTPHALSLVAAALTMVKRKPIRIFTRRVEFSIFRHNFLGLNQFKYRKGTDHIIAISKGVKEQLLKDHLPQGMVSVVHSGIDICRYQDCSGEHLQKEFNIPSGAPVLGNIGFLEENKGQEHLLRAITLVIKEIPEVRLFILGKGRLEQTLRSLAHQLGIDKSVIFTGFRNDVGHFLKMFDLLVVSSIEEGLNTSVMDALALKVPVVATNVGGIPEVITHQGTGFLVPPGNHSALAKGILWMLENRPEANRLAEEGHRMVREQFSDTAMVRNNLEVYRRLINKQELSLSLEA